MDYLCCGVKETMRNQETQTEWNAHLRTRKEPQNKANFFLCCPKNNENVNVRTTLKAARGEKLPNEKA